MSRNASGTYTLPASNPVVSGTTIATAWANTSLADLAAEVTDSLSRSGKGGMLTSLKLGDGTVTAPAVTFTNETNSGLYRAAASDMRLAVGGVDRLRLTGTLAGFSTEVNLTGSPVLKATAVSAQLELMGNQAAADANADVLVRSQVTRTAGYLFGVQNLSANRLLLGFNGDLRLGGTGVIDTIDANLGLTLRGNKAAADAGADVVLNTVVTRTAGKLLSVQNNGVEQWSVAYDGSLTLAGGGNFVLATGTNTGLTLRGNRDAADLNADVIADGSITRTAGRLFSIQNNGAERFYVQYDGTVRLAGQGVADIHTDQTNSTLALHGKRDAADTGTDVIIRSDVTRTAGKLLSVQNNGIEKWSLDYNGVPSSGAGGVTAWKTADQTITGVFANVTGMSFAVAANKTYSFVIEGHADRTVGTANMQAQITGPAAPTFVGWSISSQQDVAADVNRTTTGFSSALNLLGAVGNYHFRFMGQVVNGVNAGTVQLQINGSSSGGSDTVIIKTGMTLTVYEMP